MPVNAATQQIQKALSLEAWNNLSVFYLNMDKNTRSRNITTRNEVNDNLDKRIGQGQRMNKKTENLTGKTRGKEKVEKKINQGSG